MRSLRNPAAADDAHYLADAKAHQSAGGAAAAPDAEGPLSGPLPPSFAASQPVLHCTMHGRPAVVALQLYDPAVAQQTILSQIPTGATSRPRAAGSSTTTTAGGQWTQPFRLLGQEYRLPAPRSGGSSSTTARRAPPALSIPLPRLGEPTAGQAQDRPSRAGSTATASARAEGGAVTPLPLTPSAFLRSLLPPWGR
jgi:hypothetical protein